MSTEVFRPRETPCPSAKHSEKAKVPSVGELKRLAREKTQLFNETFLAPFDRKKLSSRLNIPQDEVDTLIYKCFRPRTEKDRKQFFETVEKWGVKVYFRAAETVLTEMKNIEEYAGKSEIAALMKEKVEKMLETKDPEVHSIVEKIRGKRAELKKEIPEKQMPVKKQLKKVKELRKKLDDIQDSLKTFRKMALKLRDVYHRDEIDMSIGTNIGEQMYEYSKNAGKILTTGGLILGSLAGFLNPLIFPAVLGYGFYNFAVKEEIADILSTGKEQTLLDIVKNMEIMKMKLQKFMKENNGMTEETTKLMNIAEKLEHHNTDKTYIHYENQKPWTWYRSIPYHLGEKKKVCLKNIKLNVYDDKAKLLDNMLSLENELTKVRNSLAKRMKALKLAEKQKTIVPVS